MPELNLARRVGEVVWIDGPALVRIHRVRSKNVVDLKIEADSETKIVRGEIVNPLAWPACPASDKPSEE